MENRLRNTNLELSQLRAQHEQAVRDASRFKAQVSDLEKRNRSLEEELRMTQNKLSTEVQRSKGLESSLASCQAELATTRSQLDSAQRELDSKGRTITSLERDKQNLDEELKRCRLDLTAARNELSDCRST